MHARGKGERKCAYRDGRADGRAVIVPVIVGCDRGAHEGTRLVEAAGRALGALGRRDEGVGVGRHVVAVLLVLDLFLRRQVFQVVLEVVGLQGLAERQLLGMSDTCSKRKKLPVAIASCEELGDRDGNVRDKRGHSIMQWFNHYSSTVFANVIIHISLGLKNSQLSANVFLGAVFLVST